MLLLHQSGLADIRAWVSYMGVGWCGEVADAEAALEHSSQAVRYLLVGKDDCVRKATKVGATPNTSFLHRSQQTHTSAYAVRMSASQKAIRVHAKVLQVLPSSPGRHEQRA